MPYPTDFTFRRRRGPGIAAWNDFSPVAAAVRESLLKAAQVEIPDRTFVFLFLAVYLIVLVPFNWSIFHTFDRVEWAWIAAPIIALVIHRAGHQIGSIGYWIYTRADRNRRFGNSRRLSSRASYPVQRLIYLAIHAVRF